MDGVLYSTVKNIFFRPQNNESKLYFINVSKKEVIKEVLIRENYLNEIEVEKKIISESSVKSRNFWNDS